MKIKIRMIAVILLVISIIGVCCMFSGCQTEEERVEANSCALSGNAGNTGIL